MMDRLMIEDSQTNDGNIDRKMVTKQMIEGRQMIIDDRQTDDR